MKCPQCHKEGLKYVERSKKNPAGKGGARWEKRTNLKVRCNKCGWKGITQ